MGPRGRLWRAERKEFGRPRYLFGDTMIGDEKHRRIKGPKIYKHDRWTAN